MKDYLKKSGRMLGLSKVKMILVLIIICCLILGGLSPTINSILINNNSETLKDDYNKNNNEEYKKTGLDDDVSAHASFYWRPQYPDPGEKVTFYSTSSATNGHISFPSWTFSDGYTDHGSIAAHTFEKKGSYSVTLRVTAHGYHGDRDWDLCSHTVKVGADPFPKIKCAPEDPAPGEEVKLDGSGSSDPDGEIILYNWSYYDVNDPENITYLGSDVVIYHKWEKQGTYIVSLIIEDDRGNSNTLEITIDVSILKLTDFNTFSRKINFGIINHGDITANNVKWSVEIYKYKIFRISSKPFYQKSDTISTLNPGDSEIIKPGFIRRRLCRIKLVVTVEADNAMKVSKTFYGRIIGKFIYLKENNAFDPLINTFKFIIIAWAGLTLLSFIVLAFSNIRPA